MREKKHVRIDGADLPEKDGIKGSFGKRVNGAQSAEDVL
jgi:hypothetical protein